jgi:nitrite reductase/ring-hydroxylating ferredoxin subunit
VKDAAPEVGEVTVEGMTDPPPASPVLLQIGPPPADSQVGWVTLPDIGPPSARPVTASAGGMTVLVCAVRGTLYAYRDACATCGSSMADGQLDREVLTCACGSRYDVRAAGRGVADPAVHLEPLPLLSDSQGVRVAVPAGASP